jgi:hypothetical protein
MERRPERTGIRTKALELGIKFAEMYSKNLKTKYRVKIYAYLPKPRVIKQLIEYAESFSSFIDYVDKPIPQRGSSLRSINFYFQGSNENMW